MHDIATRVADATQSTVGDSTARISMSQFSEVVAKWCPPELLQAIIRMQEPATVSQETAMTSLNENATETTIKGPGGREVIHFTNTFAGNPKNEDRVADPSVTQGFTSYSLFDGHGGSNVSDDMQKDFSTHLSKAIEKEFKSVPVSQRNPETIKRILTSAYVKPLSR